jgi:hypothetical protein
MMHAPDEQNSPGPPHDMPSCAFMPVSVHCGRPFIVQLIVPRWHGAAAGEHETPWLHVVHVPATQYLLP